MKKLKKSLCIPVKFKTYSGGDATCHIGFSIDRANMSMADADEYLVERQIKGTLAVGEPPQEGGLRQKLIVEDMVVSLSGVFSTGKIGGWGRKSFSSGVTFMLSEVDASLLPSLSNRTGFLWIDEAGDEAADVADVEPVTVSGAEEKPAKKKPAKKLALAKPRKQPAKRKRK